MNAAFAQVTQALFIVVDILLEVSGLGLDMFVVTVHFLLQTSADRSASIISFRFLISSTVHISPFGI